MESTSVCVHVYVYVGIYIQYGYVCIFILYLHFCINDFYQMVESLSTIKTVFDTYSYKLKLIQYCRQSYQ